MRIRIAYYLFVLLLATGAGVLSWNLNREALVNHLELFSILEGRNPERVKSTPQFNAQATDQINYAISRGANRELAAAFQRSLQQPSKFLVKVQQLFIWHNGVKSKTRIKGNSYDFYVVCNPAHPFSAYASISLKNGYYYIDSISGIDSALILASGVQPP